MKVHFWSQTCTFRLGVSGAGMQGSGSRRESTSSHEENTDEALLPGPAGGDDNSDNEAAMEHELAGDDSEAADILAQIADEIKLQQQEAVNLRGIAPSTTTEYATMLGWKSSATKACIANVASLPVFIAGRRPDRSVQDHPHRLI
eukprot:m.795305 g.795305  ORF g.795305 m.795305 type:complete len:145 (+) comp23341_c0_seq34:2145-2579(+)